MSSRIFFNWISILSLKVVEWWKQNYQPYACLISTVLFQLVSPVHLSAFLLQLDVCVKTKFARRTRMCQSNQSDYVMELAINNTIWECDTGWMFSMHRYWVLIWNQYFYLIFFKYRFRLCWAWFGLLFRGHCFLFSRKSIYC